MSFERVEIIDRNNGAMRDFKTMLGEIPVSASGNYSPCQVLFDLSWRGGYKNGLDPNIRAKIREIFLADWQKKTSSIKDTLEQLRAIRPHTPIEEMKEKRRVLKPFPGVVMTYEGIRVEVGGIVIQTRVGNYAELILSHPQSARLFPGYEVELQRVIRGMGVLIIAETSDDFHIFGQRSANVMGAGRICTLGITPNISDEQMRSFVSSGGYKRIVVPGSWLAHLIKEDISEPDELNLKTEDQIQMPRLLGAIPDPASGWMILVYTCKVDASSQDIERNFQASPNHEYNNFIFVKNDPNSLVHFLTTRHNIYPTIPGGYHAYFKSIYPSFL